MKIKNIRSFLVFFIFTLSFSSPLKVFAERILDFNSQVDIRKDGTVEIVETIKYDFESAQKHGLFRRIDFKRTNQDNKTYIIDIDVLSVTDENGNPYNFSTSKIGSYIELKIGDADKLISGQKTYIIKYKLSGSMTYFTDHDEFYWNLVGFDWLIPIRNFTASISVPESIRQDDLKYICYEGVKDSTSQSCLINYFENKIQVSSSKSLNPGENVTVSLSFPKNAITVLEPREDKPSIFLKIFQVFIGLLLSLWYVFLPVKIFINYLKQRSFLKNNQRIVSAWFEPPQYDGGNVFSPAETGFIVDGVIDHKELTATIIHLAQRGFLKIKEDDKKHFSFVRLKSIDSPDLRNFEQQVMSAIFKEGVSIKDLDDKTVEAMTEGLSNLEKFNDIIKIPQLVNLENEIKGTPVDVKEEVRDTDLKKSKTMFGKITKFNKYVEEEVVEKGMFEDKPTETYTKNMTLFALGLTTFNLPLTIAGFIAGKKSVKRTLKGIEKYSEAMSLMNFLKSQDEQLNYQSMNQMFFEKLLPYAAAFGVEKIWAKRFKDITLTKPDWYEGSNFSNSVFIGSMTQNIGGSMKSSYSSGMSSTRSSSGFSSGFSGGSSGGGGGGGGGGSW